MRICVAITTDGDYVATSSLGVVGAMLMGPGGGREVRSEKWEVRKACGEGLLGRGVGFLFLGWCGAGAVAFGEAGMAAGEGLFGSGDPEAFYF